jgi:hypothetical protein
VIVLAIEDQEKKETDLRMIRRVLGIRKNLKKEKKPKKGDMLPDPGRNQDRNQNPKVAQDQDPKRGGKKKRKKRRNERRKGRKSGKGRERGKGRKKKRRKIVRNKIFKIQSNSLSKLFLLFKYKIIYK